MMEKEIRFINFDEIETRDSDDKSYLRGYAVKWDKMSVDLGGWQENFSKGAFTRSLSNRDVMAFWNHNYDILLGTTRNKTLTLQEDEKGLRFELELPDTSSGKDAKILIKRGDVKGMSFGFRSVIEEWDDSKDIIIRTVKEAELFEISPTHSPAYPQSKVSARSLDNVFEERKIKINQIERNNKIRDNLIKNEEVKK